MGIENLGPETFVERIIREMQDVPKGGLRTYYAPRDEQVFFRDIEAMLPTKGCSIVRFQSSRSFLGILLRDKYVIRKN